MICKQIVKLQEILNEVQINVRRQVVLREKSANMSTNESKRKKVIWRDD